MPTEAATLRRLRLGARSGVALAVGLGALLALCICLAAGQDVRWAVVLLCGLAGLGVWPLLARFPGLPEKLLLFAMTASMSISLKVHPFHRTGHVGGSVGTRICITDILLVLLCVAWLLAPRRPRTIRLHIDTPILVAFAVYLAFAAWSTLFSADRELGAFQLWAYLEAFLVFVILSNFVTTSQRFKIAVAGFLVGLVLQSLATVVQVERPGQLQLAFLGGQEEIEEVRGSAAMALPEWDRGTTTLGGEIRERPVGLLIHPNVLGVYFVLAIPLAAAACLATGSFALQVLGIGALGLGAIALYLSLSRSGWAGVACAAAIAAILAVRWRALRLSLAQRTVLALAALAAAVGLTLKLGTISERLTATLRESLEFRVDLAQTAWNMLEHRLFTGVGLNTFVHAMPDYDVTGMSRLQTFPVHNIYLLELSETGLPGGIAFMVLVAVILTRAFSLARSCPEANPRLYTICLAAGIAGFWLAEMSGFVYRIPIMTTLFWSHLALVVGAARASRVTAA